MENEVQMFPELRCPNCGYKSLYWRKRAGSYSCQKCGKTCSRKAVTESAGTTN